VPLLAMNKNRRYRDTIATITLPDGTIKTKWFPSFKEAGQMLLTFALVVFGWIIFRATGMKTLTLWVSGIFDGSLFSVPWLMNRYYYIPLAISIIVMLMGEWMSRVNDKSVLSIMPSKFLIMITEIIMIVCFYLFAPVEVSEFIYFQF
jgi:hypothetical protein